MRWRRLTGADLQLINLARVQIKPDLETKSPGRLNAFTGRVQAECRSHLSALNFLPDDHSAKAESGDTRTRLRLPGLLRKHIALGRPQVIEILTRVEAAPNPLTNAISASRNGVSKTLVRSIQIICTRLFRICTRSLPRPHVPEWHRDDATRRPILLRS